MSQKGFLGTNVVTQVGIIVRDIEKTAKDFAEFFGIDVPEWAWTDGIEKAKTRFRGADTVARAKLAFMKFGQLDIELIEPNGEPSTWREYLDQHGEGIHHLAFVIEGMKERVENLESAGHPAVQRGEYTGGRYTYVDTTRSLKTVIELLENDTKADAGPLV